MRQSKEVFSNLDIYLAIGIQSLSETANEEIRVACDTLERSCKVSDYHVKSILKPIRNAQSPLHMYRVGLKALVVSDEYVKVA